MFGYTIIKKADLKQYQKDHERIQTLINVHRWFSCWNDLDIIWDYIFADTYFGSIGSCRDKYAKARKTNDYGVPLVDIKRNLDGVE